MNLMSGSVTVETTSGRGFTPEEIAHRCARKLVSIADTAPPVIRDQAIAYRDRMELVLVGYMKEAIQGDRTTIYNAIKDAGHPELAELIRRL